MRPFVVSYSLAGMHHVLYHDREVTDLWPNVIFVVKGHNLGIM